MFQRIRQWLAFDSDDRPVMLAEPPSTPRPRQSFPHKPDTLPHVHGFKFQALMLDGRVLDGEVFVAGDARWLMVIDPKMYARNTMQAQTHSIQGWRHVE